MNVETTNDVKKNDGYDESGCSLCRRVFTWLFQLILWISLFSIIFCAALGSGIHVIQYVGLGVSYFFYFIFELCSSTFSYLTHMNNANGIHSVMGGYFRTPIKVVFEVVCYHYEWRYTGSGKNRRLTREKVVTYRGYQDFVYFSWKDISGNFLLDTHEAIKSDKIMFIKLKLDLKYFCHDNFTENDLNFQRNQFFSVNRSRDAYMDTSTSVKLDGYQDMSLIKIKDVETPFFFGAGWFVFFTFIIPVAQIYKYYIQSYCSFQYFVIKKELSTRVDLNAEHLRQRFEDKAPKITIERSSTNYFENTNLLHDTPELPNEKDLQIHGEWIDPKPYVEGNDTNPGNQNYDSNFLAHPTTQNENLLPRYN